MEKNELLNESDLLSVKGGKRYVTKFDTDGDGEWDVKVVYNDETGKEKWVYR